MKTKLTPQEVAENLIIAKGFVLSRPELYKSLQIAADDELKIANGEYAPAIHGQWKDYGDKIMCCTHCGFPAAYYPYRRKTGKEQNLSEYCPNCGALMGGKDDSHETD